MAEGILGDRLHSLCQDGRRGPALGEGLSRTEESSVPAPCGVDFLVSCVSTVTRAFAVAGAQRPGLCSHEVSLIMDSRGRDAVPPARASEHPEQMCETRHWAADCFKTADFRFENELQKSAQVASNVVSQVTRF